jgi:hypothetical protein
MKFTPDPKTKWKTKFFDESILKDLPSDRERAELETRRDLAKPIEQLLSDVHEETHNKDRQPIENIASSQKRMVSLMARVAITNDKLARRMLHLTWAIVIMTLILVALTIVLVIRA